MSAYLVDPSTIKWIATAAIKGHIISSTREIVYKYPLDDEAVAIERLAKDMAKLNLLAVDVRYSSKPDELYIAACRDAVAKAPGNRVLDPYQLLKALVGFLYQCKEGSVVEEPLFLALTQWKNAIACQLVSRSERYQRAEWV